MLYQNRQVVLSNFRRFPGVYLVKLNRYCAPESFATVARAANYNAQKGDEKAPSGFQRSEAKPARRAAPAASLQSKTERATCAN
jgi:hypothetical protein